MSHLHRAIAEAQIQARATRADLDLQRLVRRPGTLVAGPWLSEVGFEVLYWLPLLRHVLARHGVGPERVVAVTRGGAGGWYADLAARSIDAFEFITPDELRTWQERRYADTRSQKQLTVHGLDELLHARVRDRLAGESITLLHPSLMYGLWGAFWARRRPIGHVERRAAFRALPVPAVSAAAQQAIDALPPGYVAVKAYFSSSFPATDANREWLGTALAALAERVPVVLLSTGIAVDDHDECGALAAEGRLATLEHVMRPEDNLAVQSRVIAGASALLSTYGGFSYLGPFLGTSSFCFFSTDAFNQTHLDVMARASRALSAPDRDTGFVAFDVREAKLLETVLAAAERGVAA